ASPASASTAPRDSGRRLCFPVLPLIDPSPGYAGPVVRVIVEDGCDELAVHDFERGDRDGLALGDQPHEESGAALRLNIETIARRECGHRFDRHPHSREYGVDRHRSGPNAAVGTHRDPLPPRISTLAPAAPISTPARRTRTPRAASQASSPSGNTIWSPARSPWSSAIDAFQLPSTTSRSRGRRLTTLIIALRPLASATA